MVLTWVYSLYILYIFYRWNGKCMRLYTSNIYSMLQTGVGRTYSQTQTGTSGTNTFIGDEQKALQSGGTNVTKNTLQQRGINKNQKDTSTEAKKMKTKNTLQSGGKMTWLKNSHSPRNAQGGIHSEAIKEQSNPPFPPREHSLFLSKLQTIPRWCTGAAAFYTWL